jgi:predicted amidohydrolase YtcJ
MGTSKRRSSEAALRLCLLICGSLFLQFPEIAAQSSPDHIIFNADIRTMNRISPRAEAIAVRDGLISAVGTTAEIRKLAGENTKSIDAQGRLLLPGFNDAHVHFAAIGNLFSSIDLSEAKRPEDVIARLRHFARFLPKGRWILGGKLDPSVAIPLSEIDAATPDNPLLVYHADAKSAVTNSLAIRAARLSAAAGIVRDSQLAAVKFVVPANHIRDLPAILETASNYAASFGVTSVQDMHSDDLSIVAKQLHRDGRLKTRIYDCVSLANWAKLAAVGTKAGSGDAMVRTGCVKGHYDEDDAGPASLGRDIAAADSAGLQVMVHAIGPKANQAVLTAMEAAIRANGTGDRRFRVEHARDLRPMDIARFSRSKIIPSMQPILFFSDSAGGSDDHRRLLDSGAQLALGADAPMRGFNPLDGIHAAVNAGGKRGITVEEAVYAYTMGAAFAEFQEKEKGSIEVGKLADLVMLSADIFAEKTDIRTAYVVMTFVNGRVVYENK